MGLRTRIGEKAFARSVAAYRVSGDVLMCSSNEATSGTTAAVESSLVKHDNHCHSARSICLLHRPSRESNWDVVRITTPTSLKCFMMARIPAIPSGMQYCF